jgi:poly(U)-specific endoribonuclease
MRRSDSPVCKQCEKIQESKAEEAAVVPSADELGSLSLACSKLWDLDVNRLHPGIDYAIDLQRGKSSYQEGDFAARPLFKFVKEEIFVEKPTYAKFIALLDNYERAVGLAEHVTVEEKKENWDFLESVMETPCGRYLHAYLVQKRRYPDDLSAFKKRLYDMWFMLYTRKVRNDSSGFEHVFVGEMKDGQVSGFHNWIQILLEEKSGRLDYKGYIKPRRRGRAHDDPHDFEQLVTIQFAWEGDLKPVGSSFIGTSPEFEFALFTLCFAAGAEENIVRIGPYKLNVKCFRMAGKVGTAFPEAISFTPDEAASKIQAHFRGRNARKNGPGPRRF